MTTFEDVPALMVRVLVEGVQVASQRPREKRDVLADDGLCISGENLDDNTSTNTTYNTTS